MLDAEQEAGEPAIDEKKDKHADLIKGMQTEPDKVLDYVLSLREDTKKYRLDAKSKDEQLKKFHDEQEAQKNLKLQEDGKLQELVDKQNQDLENFSKVKELNEQYEARFQKEYEEKKKNLSEPAIKMIDERGTSYIDKLTLADSFLAEAGKSTDSLFSERAGANHNQGTGADLVEQYQKSSSTEERMKIYETIEKQNPALLQQL